MEVQNMQASSIGPEGKGPRSRPGYMSAATAALLFIVTAVLLLLILLVSSSGPAAAQGYISPHGGFSAASQLCAVCHAMHEAPGNKLLKDMPESALCFTCHNGTGSVYNTQVQMDQDPATYAMHPISVNLANNQGNYTYTSNTTAGIAPPGPYDCSQCHNPHAGDSGASMLLRGSYETAEYVSYVADPDPYNACWACHSTSIVDDSTYFREHRRHIRIQQSSCSACHYSPHGVTHVELIRFNPSYVAPSAVQGSGPAFVDNGDHSGSCTLTCHGVDHGPYNY